ncbi:MAG: hypothetical protein AB7U83_07355 [Vicinamibacterales bacterium]
MTYMIHVDVEHTNEGGAVRTCSSPLHEPLGPHYDLTVHALGCRIRDRHPGERPGHYWDDHGGAGFSLEALPDAVAALTRKHPEAHPRRCIVCEVGPHLPQWD